MRDDCLDFSGFGGESSKINRIPTLRSRQRVYNLGHEMVNLLPACSRLVPPDGRGVGGIRRTTDHPG